MYPNIYCSFENKELALQHAMAVFGNTNQKVCVTGQEFVRGRGNRGRRKDRDDYGVITPKKVNDEPDVIENVVQKDVLMDKDKEIKQTASISEKEVAEDVYTNMNFGEIGLGDEQQENETNQSTGNEELEQAALLSSLMSMTENN